MTTASTIEVYVETGKRRVFAGALEWPGWCRSARDEDAALEALLAYGARYALVAKRARKRFKAPASTSDLRVVQRLKGDVTTDFGAPSKSPSADDRPMDDAETKRQCALLAASWAALDAAAEAAGSAVLRKGPRGGGRDLDAIVSHVLEADKAYLRSLGGRFETASPQKDNSRSKRAGSDETASLRETMLGAVRSRARGEPPARTPRSGTLWTPRYTVRRSAWHALDHAWEIEDRAT